MDPFIQIQNNTIIDEINVIIFGEKCGRRSNTYIIGWNISEVESKSALEKMKKQFGCGGSIKMVNYEGTEQRALHLQGDKITKVEQFLKNMNIQNLTVKELII
jgi:translation initiation factor 1 (eIF-1/SUI1)